MDVLRAEDVNNWYTHDTPDESDNVSLDPTSYEDDRSSSYRSDSVASSGGLRKSRQRSKTNSSAVSRSDYSCNSEFSKSIVPSAKSEDRILQLLAGSGYPMTQVNGQRKLGPPPGWTKPAPDPSCEVFVGKLPRDLHEDAIYPIFHQIGEIYEIRLLMDFSGTNRGYCFVMYTKSEYAQQAIKLLNNWEISKGQRIGVVASVNNCRLCIGQLPSNIDSEVIMNKFFNTTDEVSSVSVYKNENGYVRYALVLYCNHRAAAMARRSLLPQRGNLFDSSEITIDWAHPDMVPNNVVEEKGTRDESGHLKISRTEIGPREWCDNSRKRQLREFPVPNVERNGPNHRNNKSLEFSRRGVFGRGRCQRDDFSGVQKTPNHFRHMANRGNQFGHFENGSATCFSGNRDINGNIEISEIRRLADSRCNEKTALFRGNELSVVAQNARSGNYAPSFNLVKGYTVALNKSPTEIGADDQSPGAVSRDCLPATSFLQARESLIGISNSQALGHCSDHQNKKFELFSNWRFAEKTPIHRENERIESAPCIARKHLGLPNVERPRITNETKRSTNFRVPGQRPNQHFQVPQPTNTHGFVGNLVKNPRNNGGTTNGNNGRAVDDNFSHRVPQPFCRECHDQAQLFLCKFVLQASNPLVSHGTHVFDNYFRGPNGRAVHSTPACADRNAEKRHILLPFCSIVPRSLYATSSFADYSTPAPISIEKPQSRCTASPNPEKLDETIFNKPRYTPAPQAFVCEQQRDKSAIHTN